MAELLTFFQHHEQFNTQNHQEAPPIIKRELMRRVNLNYSQLTHYFDLLENHDLAVISKGTDGSELITTTSRAKEFLELICDIQILLDSEKPYHKQ